MPSVPMKRSIASVLTAAALAFATTADAVLVNDAVLSIDSGSFFTMGGSTTVQYPGWDGQYITGYNGLVLGTAQTATGSHGGLPGCTAGVGSCNNPGENPNIDNPWAFFGNTGMHLSTSPVDVLSASGNSATLDFSGWTVSWNGSVFPFVYPAAAWYPGTSDGIANVTCALDCGDGDAYSLIYSAYVCDVDGYCEPSDFGPTYYFLYLTGTIAVSEVPLPAAVWLLGAGLMGVFGAARRHRAPGV